MGILQCIIAGYASIHLNQITILYKPDLF